MSRHILTLSVAAQDLPEVLAVVREQQQIARAIDALARFYAVAGKRRGDALVKRVMVRA